MRIWQVRALISISSLVMLFVAYSAHGAVVATYEFQNTLNATPDAGPADPALVAVAPLANPYVVDLVFGQPRTVYRFDGPGATQSGLTLDTTGLILPTTYSVEMAFKFDDNLQWRRVFGAQNLDSDGGFYADVQNRMYVVGPGGSGPGPTQPAIGFFDGGQYHHVVVTVSGPIINGYLDGGVPNTKQMSVNTNSLEITSTGDLLSFFLDNTSGPGVGEFSDGNIAFLRIFDHVLSPSEAEDTYTDFIASAAVPEPGTATLSLIGLGIFAATRLRKRRRNVAPGESPASAG